MQFFDSCKKAIMSCIETQTYSVAHLLSSEHTLDMHIHDCCEVYYSISGGKKFLINNHLYPFEPGDIFFINHSESHHLLQVEEGKHERYVINIHPRFIQNHSSVHTDLGLCFDNTWHTLGHKLSLTSKEQQRFLFLIHKLSSLSSTDFGVDIMEQLVFIELMVFFNELFSSKRNSPDKTISPEKHYKKTNEIITYINQHLADNLNLSILSKHFSISSSHLNRIFKEETGTTLQKYIVAQRIALAKTLLSEGLAVTEVFLLSGFGDYSNFYKTFTKMVGVSPKSYAINSAK